MSNDTLTHAVDAPSNINNNLATQIGGTQATTVTTEDAALVSWSRTPMASASTGTVAASLSTTWISVWEFTNLITNKPNPSDPTTYPTKNRPGCAEFCRHFKTGVQYFVRRARQSPLHQ